MHGSFPFRAWNTPLNEGGMYKMPSKEAIALWKVLGMKGYKKEEPKRLSLETIKEINSRIEQMGLDYDIPYPSGRELREWQLECIKNN